MKQDFERLEEIVKKVSELSEKHAGNEASELKAFNLFTILRDSREEVALHSRFIAELLNANGSHKQPIFQKLFIEHVVNGAIEGREPIPENLSFDCKYEHGVGDDGRIDISLKGSDYAVVIENKIDAADQKRQLERYYKACTKTWGINPDNVHVLYLTLDGDDVSDYGLGDLSSDNYGTISYKEDILKWLGACIEHCTEDEHCTEKLPSHLRENIIQYKNLVGKLTGVSEGLMKDLSGFLKEAGNFKAVYDASKALNKVQIDTQLSMWKEMQASFLRENYNFSFVRRGPKFFETLEFASFEEEVKKYYKKRKNPGVTYGLECEIGQYSGCQIHLYVEIYHQVYFGLCASLLDDEKDDEKGRLFKSAESVDLKELSERASKLVYPFDSSPVKRFIGGKLFRPKEQVNFKEIKADNTHFFKLIEEKSRKEWIEETCEGIIEFIVEAKKILQP